MTKSSVPGFFVLVSRVALAKRGCSPNLFDRAIKCEQKAAKHTARGDVFGAGFAIKLITYKPVFDEYAEVRHINGIISGRINVANGIPLFICGLG